MEKREPKTRPQMLFHGTGHVFVTASSSRSGLFHWTVIGTDGQANCTCEGWRTHRNCWHVSMAQERCGQSGETTTDFQVNL